MADVDAEGRPETAASLRSRGGSAKSVMMADVDAEGRPETAASIRSRDEIHQFTGIHQCYQTKTPANFLLAPISGILPLACPLTWQDSPDNSRDQSNSPTLLAIGNILLSTK
jgi:hypothetical protein